MRVRVRVHVCMCALLNCRFSHASHWFVVLHSLCFWYISCSTASCIRDKDWGGEKGMGNCGFNVNRVRGLDEGRRLVDVFFTDKQTQIQH